MTELYKAAPATTPRAYRRTRGVRRHTAPITPTPPAKAAAITRILKESASIATGAQNARALRILREVGEVTAMELQQLADLRHPPARILQLKKAGHSIVSRWVVQVSNLGHAHRTAMYVLTREALS